MRLIGFTIYLLNIYKVWTINSFKFTIINLIRVKITFIVTPSHRPRFNTKLLKQFNIKELVD